MDNNITSQGGQDVTQLEGMESIDNQVVLPQTKEELEALLQREGDRRVSSAHKKWKEQQLEIIKTEKAKAVEEADRLAKMTAAEREKAKFEKEKQEFFAEKEKLEKPYSSRGEAELTNSFEDAPQVCAPTQIATQRKRLRSGKEEQGGGRMTLFCA